MALLLLIVATYGCERDDICAAATPTTPRLNIAFYDINNPEVPKPAPSLSVRGFDLDGNELPSDIVSNMDRDSILLPLHISNEPITSRFALEKDTDFRLDEDPATESNIDIIEVSYIPEFVYVSRACGYKSIFKNLSITIEPDGNNWIISSEIVNTTIENETTTHIILRH